MAKKLNLKTAANPERHEARCKICRDPRRQEIEDKFTAWVPQTQIVRQHGISAVGLWRHVKASGLFTKRDANLRAALAAFIERGARVRVTAASFVAAVIAYSKLDPMSRTVDRVENLNTTNQLFSRMTQGEMLRYAETGVLPEWWPTEKQ